MSHIPWENAVSGGIEADPWVGVSDQGMGHALGQRDRRHGQRRRKIPADGLPGQLRTENMVPDSAIPASVMMFPEMPLFE